MTVDGLDVSEWQATTPDLSSVGFVIVKASEGTRHDPRYPQHVNAARAAGKVVGAYCFGRDDVALVDQVATFLSATAAAPPDLYALDVERASDLKTMPEVMARAFVAAVQASGRRCGLYASASGYPEVGQDWRWVADWRPLAPFPANADVWQYRGSPLDLDRWRGDMASLQTFAHRGNDVPGLTFHFDPTPSGVAEVSVDGASLIIVASRIPIAVPRGQRRRVYGSVVLAPALNAQLGWPGTGTGDRVHAWLIGEIAGTPADSPGVEAAILLHDNATFTPDTLDCSAERSRVIAAAVAAVQAVR